MSVIKVEILERKYRIPHPTGQDAVDLFLLASEVIAAKDAQETYNEAPDVSTGVLRAARRLAASRDIGLAAAKATLIGGSIDGKPITGETFREEFAEFGRFLEPFILTWMAWDRLGFTSVVDGSRPEPEKPEPEKPVEDSV